MGAVTNLGRRAVWIAVACASALSVAPESHAQTLVTSEARTTPVTAYDGQLVFSRWVPSQRRYRLMRWTGAGSVQRLPVPGRTVPFDADLGPDTDGRAAVVYSRCRRETPDSEVSAGLGCDVYKLRLGADHEHRVTLRGVNTAAATETRPTLWRGSLAFVRAYERRRGRAGVRPHVMLRVAGKRPEEVTGGPTGSYAELRYRGGRHPSTPRAGESQEGPTRLDLDGRHLVFDWSFAGRGCPEPANDPDFLDETQATQIRAVTYGQSRRSRTIDRACSGNAANYVYGPALSPGGTLLYTAQVFHGDVPFQQPLRQLTGAFAGTGREQTVTPTVVSTAIDDASVFFTRRADTGIGVDVYTETRAAFDAAASPFTPLEPPSPAPDL